MIDSIVSLIINMLIVFTISMRSQLIPKVMGKSGAKAVGKVVILTSTGIIVMMIRSGIPDMLKGF